jgi:hypothetical protein
MKKHLSKLLEQANSCASLTVANIASREVKDIVVMNLRRILRFIVIAATPRAVTSHLIGHGARRSGKEDSGKAHAKSLAIALVAAWTSIASAQATFEESKACRSRRTSCTPRYGSAAHHLRRSYTRRAAGGLTPTPRSPPDCHLSLRTFSS